MAFTIKDFIDPTTGHPRYNIDQTLRSGSRGVDTQLLQVLLNMLYFDLAPAAARFGLVPPVPRLVEDGIAGSQTGILTNHFFDNAPKAALLVDRSQHPEAGGVDPMRKPNQLSTRLKVRFFIDALNLACSSFSVQLGQTRYPLLRTDPTVPVALRNALKTVKLKATKYQFER